MSEMTVKILDAASRVVHLTITPDQVGSSTLTGEQVVDILHTLSRAAGRSSIESVTFENFEVSGIINLCHESSASVVAHIAFNSCRNLLIWATRSRLTSLSISNSSIDRIIAQHASFSVDLSIESCSISTTSKAEGVDIRIVDLRDSSIARLTLARIGFTANDGGNEILLGGSRVAGNVVIDTIMGVDRIDLERAYCAGSVEIKTILSSGHTPNEREFNLSAAKIDHDLRCSNMNGLPINAKGARIGGSAQFDDIKIVARVGHWALAMQTATIGGDLQFTKCQIKGTLCLNNTMVGAHAFFTDSNLGNGQANDFGQSDSLHAEGMQAGGALLFHNTHLIGRCYLLHCKAGVNIEFKNCSVALGSSESGLDLSGTACEGDLLLYDNRISGGLNASHLECGKSVRIRECAFLEHSPDTAGRFSIKASGMRVRGTLDIIGAIMLDNATFADTCAGELVVSGVQLTCTPGQQTFLTSQLVLARMQIGASIALGEIIASDESAVFLTDAQCNSLDLSTYVDGHYKKPPFLLLDLNGLRYQNVGSMHRGDIAKVREVIFNNELKKKRLAASYASSPRSKATTMRETARAVLSALLPRQPRSHMQLAKVLREQGWDEEANAVLWRMRKLMAHESHSPGGWAMWRAIKILAMRLFNLSFDLMFGYGYSKWRASCTLAAWIALGWFGVHMAIERGMLVVDPTFVAVIAGGVPGAGETSSLAARLPTGDISCRGVVEPMFYAVDLIIPIMDFGQVKRCGVAFGLESLKVPFYQRETTFWFFAQYIYSMLGWIVASLSALTFTGTLRDRA